MLNRTVRSIALLLLFALLAGGALADWTHGATAGPAGGEPAYSLALVDDNSTVYRRVLLDGPVTMVNTTPVNGDTVCLNGDPDLFAARLTLTGTLTGTNPTLTVVLQSSDDNGQTWMNVGSSFAAINATTTPSGGVERVTFADSASGGVNTPVAWGTCFRVRYTFGGTGTVTGDVDVRLYAE
jgi:hypothetical protein